MKCLLRIAVLGGLLGCSESDGEAPVLRAAAEEQADYLRFVELDGGSAKLETALFRMADEDGRVVDLIGAVHIGDAAYYATLNRLFRGYDALLYEMVKPADVGPEHDPDAERDRGRMSWIGTMQQFMKNTLGLDYQLEGIDYGADNFVHADLDLESFLRLQDEQGESIFSLVMSTMWQQMATDPDAAEEQSAAQLAMMLSMFSTDRAYSMKYTLGRQFGDLERLAAGFEKGPSGEESVLVGKRNAACIEVLERVLDDGERRIGIFYGAAHLPDLRRRLHAMGFRDQRTQWLTAWDVRKGE